MPALLTERQVADVAGITPRTVRRHACEFVTVHAPGRTRNGRSPRTYDVQSLATPLQQRLALLESQKAVAEESGRTFGLPMADASGSNLSPEDQAEAEARYRLIEPLIAPQKHKDLWIEHGQSKVRLVDAIGAKHGVSRRTMYAWLKAWEQTGLPGLVRRDRKDRGQPKVMTPAALDFLVSAALPKRGAYGELSIREIYRGYCEEAAWRESHIGKPLPGEFEARKYARYLDEDSRLSARARLPEVSYETLRSWFARIPQAVRTYARKGVEIYSAAEEILSFRDFATIKPLDYVVMDHRRLDFFCMVRARDGWKLIRPWLTAAIDMRTRKWLAWSVVENPSSASIASVLKRAILAYGTPKACLWDNGKDFTCEWFEGKRRQTGPSYRVGELESGMRGVLETLGIRVHHAIVRRARAKLIEPAFVATAQFDKSLPWWCGHKPGSRPDRFGELLDRHEAWVKGEAPAAAFLTIEEVAVLYDRLMNSLNEREHTGEGMRKVTPTGHGWMCPNEVWEQLIGTVERRTIPEQVLQFCFNKRRVVTVRHGEVKVTFGGQACHYRPVENANKLLALNGREVQLAYDPFDLGTCAVYFEDQFIAVVTNLQLRRMGERDFVGDERDRRRARREIRKFIDTAHRAVPVASPMERLERMQPSLPLRIDPARPEVAAELPAAVQEGADAIREDAQLPTFEECSAAAPDLVRVTAQAAYRDDDPDDEFNFFSGSGGTK